ncbi:MAG TPA: alkaline phosphatase, partial [Chitinophagaceae bacterium]|nr:alkaline phosphatase [Chitinophagaceae bacterium]
MHKFFSFLLVLAWSTSGAQPSVYSVANAHSHNDYEKEFPFWLAYNRGFGSIEADIFLHHDKLIVAHDSSQLLLNRTLDSLYLQPLQNCITKNNGNVFADRGRQLQLLVDIKSDSITTLNKLIETLGKYPSITKTRSVKIVISGKRPDPSLFSSYPEYIFFDGELNKEYAASALEKIGLLSADFEKYSLWNGKGIVPGKEKEKIEAVIRKAHQQNKKVRFWNSPDDINAWLGMIRLQVDFINTDKIDGLATFLKQLPERTFSTSTSYKAYKPLYRNDGTDKPIKNVILLIGDGTGLAHLYAGYTANKGVLNVFNMRQTGLSKTSSYDSYITDSAPGSTAFSSGVKTNNRWIGVDHT